eukprot:Mycagemm_TRINITY_DN9952_c0_g3::TRINITY_DN9952_c0_g3_i1::g.3407::m.3407 type:complete len:110 gc:universal TRINITY_DN9952_c0_g3_i1:428-99(-)
MIKLFMKYCCRSDCTWSRRLTFLAPGVIQLWCVWAITTSQCTHSKTRSGNDIMCASTRPALCIRRPAAITYGSSSSVGAVGAGRGAESCAKTSTLCRRLNITQSVTIVA